MSFDVSVAIRDLSFTYTGASDPLFSALSLHLPAGFTGVVGANGTGKSTLLQIVCGELAPSVGRVDGATDARYCAQRTDAAPTALAEFLDDWDSAAFELRGRLAVEPDFGERWPSLSHGERKRAQIACALWQQPTVLAIDEPTNHIDAPARALLIGALQGFRGVGLVVSHDRELLDALCVQCLWLDPPYARVFPGGYTKAREQRELARETAVAERTKAQREQRRLQNELAVRRERAAREHDDRSKRGLARNDHDARERLDRARVADSKAGASLRQLGGRAAQAQARLDAARVDKQYDAGIWLPGSRSRRDRLLALDASAIPLGGGRVLRVPALALKPDDRVAITGPNGAGKSTLVRAILARLDLEADRVIDLPQETALADAAAVLDAARALPDDRLGYVMNVVSRLGSRPQRLLDSRAPSPGEIRKLMLALGMARAPHLIVMDEPTNHLDLPSIEALEEALAECPCALLLVSHDERFLTRLTRIRWRIAIAADGASVLAVE